ncbi:MULTISPECIES: spore germination protein [Cytobacillus]|uniref:Spore germination protein n=1 Tax=Cytobacillus horneckiae TaxID=549687 RepID=A0A2N0ZAN4_9BACI|nr:spore germination protein [Cytobacillus horneckiae]MEC1157435.1 spore germination protein [Cytobacillus horneckiae]MED2938060.1 spore germination protein [Cytobacillus horneckiae]PKG26572.1 spore germination protein [Cytobacillus horneckiae]
MKKVQTNKKGISIDQLKMWVEGSSDIAIKTRTYHSYTIDFLYCPNLVDMKFISEVIFPAIHDVIEKNGHLNYELLNNVLEVSKLKDLNNMKEEIEQKLFSGELLIFCQDSKELFFIPVSNPPKRGPEESNMESSIRGPRDGLVENVSDNMALIRQRLKTSSLKSIEYTLGERSRTKTLLLYIDDIMNPSILETVKKRLDSIKVDSVASSYEIEEFLYDKTFTLFPLMENSGRPDFAVQSLTQGRFVLLVDGNPTCLIGPANLNQILYSPEDSHDSFFYVSMVRILRFLAIITTIYLPGFYISLTTFQLDQIPYSLIATISASRIGLPLSTPMEVFIMLVLFELFKEAGVRLPKAVGQTVAVLGGLFIGDAAIRAGLTSPACLVIVAVSVISGYILSNQTMAGNVVILRFLVLAFSSLFGLYGFFISFFLILTAVVSLESFGQPYMSYLSRPNAADIIKNILKLPYRFMKKRNQAYRPIDSDSQKE